VVVDDHDADLVRGVRFHGPIVTAARLSRNGPASLIDRAERHLP
jgi:hypothetical protein